MICVNSVSVYPKSISLKVGTWSYAAYAEVCPSDAECKEVQWHSDNPSVASVNASSGYIYANAAGTARIYATATDGSGCSDYLTVTVSNTVPVTSVTLNRSSLLIQEGNWALLSATVKPDNATNKNVNWTSSNNGVATVSGGVVTAVSKGSVRITATAQDGSGKSASCVVSVTDDILVTSITVSPTSNTMTVGDSVFLSVTVCPFDAANKCVTWSSTNPDVATVNELTGLVIAQSGGNAVIYATACDGSGVVGCCSISVNEPILVENIAVSPETVTIEVGETAELSATIYPTNAQNKSIRWTSEDSNIAEVNYLTGLVTAKSPGTAKIYANALDGSGVYGTSTVSVRSIPVISVSVSPKEKTLSVGETITLNADITPDNATNKSVVWTSSDSSVATVGQYTGIVTAKSDGTATITSTSMLFSEQLR